MSKPGQRLPGLKRLLGGLAVASQCACGGSGGGGNPPALAPPPPPPTATLSLGPEACVDGMAGTFPCSGVSLRKRVTVGALGGAAGNDVWGWVDSTTGAEYALVGMDNGTVFVDVSDPANPVVLGRLPTHTVASTWRDIKVYQEHAYIVADRAGNHGMQVFDLTRLRDAIPLQNFIADLVYGDFGSAHNIAIDEASGFAYAVGSNTCGGGLHMIDINIPNNPRFAGCHAAADTHDVQCVLYGGPDTEHAGREICVSSNEDHVAVVDVTDKADPLTLATLGYSQLGFVHQGWLTEDHRYFLLGDEADESRFGVRTRTHVFDVTDLDNPVHLYAYEATTRAIDHNLYVLGNRIFQANYAAGLRVLEFGALANGELDEVAFFDTRPGTDAVEFVGAWSAYPYFPSGTVLVSDTQAGLLILSVEDSGP